MELAGEVELFSYTFDNRFIFDLFDLLLCGVIVLVIVRGWRATDARSNSRDRLYLLLAFACLGASFALGTIFTGAFFFFRRQLNEAMFDLPAHTLRASAWLMLVASAYQRPALAQSSSRGRRQPPFLLLAVLWLLTAALLLARGELLAKLYPTATTALDAVNLLLLALALLSFHRRPLGRHNFARGALVILLIAGSLHLASYAGASGRGSTIIWNLEQFAWSLALFTFALAVGEAGSDLFDKVFVGLQITFILLASVMILVITQTEKTEYLASIRSRTDGLAEFVCANMDYLAKDGEKLPEIIGREDFLQRAMLGFGHMPELKIVRIASGGDLATFEIAEDGEVSQRLETASTPDGLARLDAGKYFLIHSVPLADAGPGAVEFYGTREVLDRHIRKRIIIIFSLFTGMVVLSTLMIGMVVRGASATIRQQAREIEETQRRLMQASKLAAIGQLATGVAHEINNPATTILSRASFVLSDEPGVSPIYREDLEAIVSQSERIAHITGNLLLFSRPVVRRVEPVAIDRVIEHSLRPVREPLEASHVSVEKDISPSLPEARADEQALARALENLYRNAIDAMPRGGVLRIRAARDESCANQLRLEVSDTGIGIDQESLARIFDPFFTTKEVGKGTGLGLSIVHGIISEHHGAITVESSPGKGTLFIITLPTEE
jgi:signal transduction histidine kinase